MRRLNPSPSKATPRAGRLFTPFVVLSLGAGLLIGLGGFTFTYASGLAYLSDDPKACANCHVMNEVYDSWRKGPHHAVATCNDCHTPSAVIPRLLSKAQNGYHHSMGFTLQPSRPDAVGARLAFSEPIRIKQFNSKTLQANCLRCHGTFVQDIVHGSTTAKDALSCVHCHSAVGHGARR